MEKKRYVRKRDPRITWWGLKEKKQDVFEDKMIKEDKWDLDKDVKKMWNEMASSFKRVTKEILEESKEILEVV